MGYNTNRLKQRHSEVLEEYDGMKEEEFDSQFRAFVDSIGDKEVITIAEIEGFLQDFEFPEANDWAWNIVNNEVDEAADQEMELERDKEMGL